MLGQQERTVVRVAERPLASALLRRATGVQIDVSAPSERDELLILTIAPDRPAVVRTGM